MSDQKDNKIEKLSRNCARVIFAIAGGYLVFRVTHHWELFLVSSYCFLYSLLRFDIPVDSRR